MNERIAIEPNLTPVKDFLTDKGYHVESINSAAGKHPQNDTFDAFVVAGQNSNFMGIHDTNSKAVVIDASGLTPEQVYNQLQSRLHQ